MDEEAAETQLSARLEQKRCWQEERRGEAYEVGLSVGLSLLVHEAVAVRLTWRSV